MRRARTGIAVAAGVALAAGTVALLRSAGAPASAARASARMRLPILRHQLMELRLLLRGEVETAPPVGEAKAAMAVAPRGCVG